MDPGKASPDPVVVSYQVDRAELARRGRRGGVATRERHDLAAFAARGRAAFLAKFSSREECSEYFSALAARSAAARRARREAEEVAA